VSREVVREWGVSSGLRTKRARNLFDTKGGREDIIPRTR
jgi:hypothetical protein